jgi:hypothetical protein
LLGILGSLVGDAVSQRATSPLLVAVVSTFLGFFLAQVLAYAKRSSGRGLRMVSLSVLQGAAVALLLLPAKNLLAEWHVASALLDNLAGLFGGELGLDAVIVASTSFVTTVTSAMSRRV